MDLKEVKLTSVPNGEYIEEVRCPNIYKVDTLNKTFFYKVKN